jgi:hypothetical protein
VGFSVLSWRQGGRGWARGAPPPPGSIEYCGVGGEAFYGVGSVWVVSASEVEAGNRWNETLARSVDYARRVHGDRVLTAEDARDFTDYYKRWKKFSEKVSTWSLVQRAREENKRVLEALVAESRRLSDKFAREGMAVIPVPHAADLVLMLRGMPRRLTPAEMARKLEAAAGWGEAMASHSRTTGEWVQRAGLYAAGAALLGPAGLLAAHYLPSSWSRDRSGLVAAAREARDAARYMSRSTDATVPYTRGDPVYDEFMRKVTRVYVEAAGLYGIQETLRAATAEAVDAGARQVDRGGSLLWLLALAGVSYLGVKWLESSRQRPVVLRVPDAVPQEET